jgi:steroid delta-isomerase-like uncharacterized protein
MSAEENKALVHRVYEAFATGDLDVIDELFADDYIDRHLLPGAPPGPEGVKFQVTTLRSGFPDAEFIAEDLVAEGDTVAVRQTFRGTHSAEFLGIPPTGRRVSMEGIGIIRFRDGKAVELTAVEDMLGFLQQLGAIPTPAATPS